MFGLVFSFLKEYYPKLQSFFGCLKKCLNKKDDETQSFCVD